MSKVHAGLIVFTAALGVCALGALIAYAQAPSDMFVPGDTDSFDAGLPVGARFPSIRALYDGQEITEVDEFMGERGLIFMANRSVDW